MYIKFDSASNLLKDNKIRRIFEIFLKMLRPRFALKVEYGQNIKSFNVEIRI